MNTPRRSTSLEDLLTLDIFASNPSWNNDSGISQDIVPQEFSTMLDPFDFTLHSTINNEVIDSQQLFNPKQETDETKEESEWTKDMNINNQPFFNPTTPFITTPQDSEQLLLLEMPSYLYKLGILKKKQQELVREEDENLFPRVINLIHDHLEPPTDNISRQKYVKERNRFLHRLLGDVMPSAMEHSFVKKVKRRDTWTKK
ncbi:uncharacterized protein BX664DRAFT_327757 [Halteromyces radiatus]|uniref:uncharacterized protein n=1 Tax=Halteromyces radiatus TaxID=101107 RepID=UPI00221E8FEC|nr:uncharacterized protein BX664DRAFT_327757 [Halteromyces radiatus]KAI8092630.1 hypothetical protein BX664DRAFT_327757 [Halteromyces radiatus]